jgi:tetratricopeptide (TPR) repeat protein
VRPQRGRAAHASHALELALEELMEPAVTSSVEPAASARVAAGSHFAPTTRSGEREQVQLHRRVILELGERSPLPESVMTTLARLEVLLAAGLIGLLAHSAPSQTPAPAPEVARSADPYAQARQLLHDQKFAEAADVFEALSAGNPYDGWIWGNRGYCLHALKRYDEAIPCFRRAVELDASPATYLYDIACAHSLMGHKDEALDWLKKALDARFVDQETLENDTDLDPLRDDPRFAVLTGITLKLTSPLAQTREERWRWDLDFYARRMKQMHWDLYNRISANELAAELDRLGREVGALDDDHARARLRKITARVGDGHTQSMLFAEGSTTVPRLPVQMYSFKEGLYVIGASREHADLLGAKVERLGALDAAAALAAARPYMSVDNEMGYLSGAPEHLALPILLREIGATSDETGVDLTVTPPGCGTRTVHLAPIETPVRNNGFFRRDLGFLHQSGKGPVPLYLRDTTRNLRMEVDHDRKLAYFAFGGIADDPDMTVAKFCDQLFDTIEKQELDHLVIDMRYNGGGNTGLIGPLINGLAAAKRVNRAGHMWVIIGRRTFSAAQNTVNLFSSFDRPIFVGEPTGSRPRFIGESTWFVLPHSKTRVYCSSRYWQVLDSTDNRCWVPPMIVAEPTFAAYAAGRDPAMEAIYAALGAASGSDVTRAVEPR